MTFRDLPCFRSCNHQVFKEESRTLQRKAAARVNIIMWLWQNNCGKKFPISSHLMNRLIFTWELAGSGSQNHGACGSWWKTALRLSCCVALVIISDWLEGAAPWSCYLTSGWQTEINKHCKVHSSRQEQNQPAKDRALRAWQASEVHYI